MALHAYMTQLLKAVGPEPTALWGSFAPNGSSNPTTSDNEGPPGVKAFTTEYAATGAFTVTLPEGCTPVGTPQIFVSAQCQSLAEHFQVCAVGAYDATNRQFVVQAHRNGTGREVAANAGARIHWVLLFNNSTGG